MGLIKKATDVDVTKQAFKFLIYGAPGTGKTTIAHSAPSTILFDFDNGRLGVNPAFLGDYVDIADQYGKDKKICHYGYEDAKEALNEACASDEYKTIIIDNVSRLRDFQTEVILRDNPNLGKVDKQRQLTGELTLQGYGALKQEFNKFMKKCTTSGKHVICITHEQGETVKRAGNEIKTFTPKISQGALADLTAEFDFIGYVYNNGTDRFISFTPTDTFYAKNRCGLQRPFQIPLIINEHQQVIGRNDFFTNFIKNLNNYIKKQVETRKAFDALIARIDKAIEDVKDVESANNLIEGIMKAAPIWDSQVVAMAHLNEKMIAMGAVWNANTKKYELAA